VGEKRGRKKKKASKKQPKGKKLRIGEMRTNTKAKINI